MVEILWLLWFVLMFTTEAFFAVFGKTRILLGNPIHRLKDLTKKSLKKKLRIWLLCNVATMDILIYSLDGHPASI
jgi:hypothetical protein